jgi:hypothetical protein
MDDADAGASPHTSKRFSQRATWIPLRRRPLVIPAAAGACRAPEHGSHSYDAGASRVKKRTWIPLRRRPPRGDLLPPHVVCSRRPRPRFTEAQEVRRALLPPLLLPHLDLKYFWTPSSGVQGESVLDPVYAYARPPATGTVLRNNVWRRTRRAKRAGGKKEEGRRRCYHVSLAPRSSTLIQ